MRTSSRGWSIEKGDTLPPITFTKKQGRCRVSIQWEVQRHSLSTISGVSGWVWTLELTSGHRVARGEPHFTIIGLINWHLSTELMSPQWFQLPAYKFTILISQSLRSLKDFISRRRNSNHERMNWAHLKAVDNSVFQEGALSGSGITLFLGMVPDLLVHLSDAQKAVKLSDHYWHFGLCNWRLTKSLKEAKIFWRFCACFMHWVASKPVKPLWRDYAGITIANDGMLAAKAITVDIKRDCSLS